MQELTPAEQAAVDRFEAATRDLTESLQNFTLVAMGAARRLDDRVRDFAEAEQREFIGIVAAFD